MNIMHVTITTRAVCENNPVVRRVVDTFVNGTIPNAQAEGGLKSQEALITHNDEYFLWKTSPLM